MKNISAALLCICFVLLSACSTGNINLGPKREVTSYSEKTFPAEQPPELDIACDSGDIEIYSWNKKEIKFEITERVRGIQTKEILQKKLKDFDVTMKQEGNKILFKSQYKGSIKSPADRSVNLKIYLPKRVLAMKYQMDIGTLKFFDDVSCTLTAQLNMVNTSINKFDGKFNVTADMGNVRVDSGFIKQGSSIKTNMGNIIIKSGFEESGEYSFETEMGNIDLTLPAHTKAAFESIGAVEVNELQASASAANVKLRSGMGKISIRKY